MELILVRHGQPAWSTPEGLGRNDPDLTELGHAQAARVAARLADTEDLPGRGDVDRLYVSPAIRAQETAAPIAAALDLPVDTRDWLWELRNPPEWEGSPMAAIDAEFARLQARTRDEWWEGHPNGESLRDFHHRVTTGLDGLLAELGVTPAEDGLWDVPAEPSDVDRVVIVAHGGTNGMITAHLLGAPAEPWAWDRFAMGHASVAVLATHPVAGHHLWSLRAMGDGTHLDVGDRTA